MRKASAAVALGLATLFAGSPALATATAPSRPASLVADPGSRLPGTSCPVFPANNVWNANISRLPVAPQSAAWVKAIDNGDPSIDLHPDFGPGGGPKTPYGIPYVVVGRSQGLVHLRFEYPSESDPGPYPFGPTTPIEGGQTSTGDRHALMVDPRTCTLYELYDATYRAAGRSTAGSGAIWNLRSNALRPATWTSADAAGLPILAGLVNYDEAMSGHLDHAIRFTAPVTDDRFIWPARHEASGQNRPDLPPMGARFRLKASFSLPSSRCGRPCQTVLTAMKDYGLILADNGSPWYFQGTADRRWSYSFVDQLKQIPASAFVAVDESSLMCSPNSGQVREPGPKGGCG